MKKYISIILAVAVCISAFLCLSGCGENGNVSKNDLEAIADSADGLSDIDESALSEFDMPDDADGLKIYNYDTDETKSSFLVVDGKASTLAYLVEDVAFFDVDGDGVNELFSLGDYDKGSESYVVLEISYYGKNVFYENLDEGYHSWALDYFPASETYGFITDENGVKFVSYTVGDDGSKTVKTDYGYATPNGPIINLSIEKNLIDKTDSPDTGVFCADEMVCTLDGKEFRPDDDFVAVINPFIADYCINIDELEEYTGFDFEEKDIPQASKSIATIYGEKYVADIAIQLFSDGSCNPFDGENQLKFMSAGYSEE